MEIEYFAHKHPLNLGKLKRNRSGYHCCVCREPVSVIGTECYSCSECKEVMIHKLCGELEEEIQHPFHPLHPLILRSRSPYRSNEFGCNACRKPGTGFVYHCAECEFDLDIRCASLVPTFSYGGHHHLLTLFEHNGNSESNRRCVCCDTDCYNFFFRCVECNYNIHKSCADDDFPKHIQHPFHPPHPLTRVDDDPERFECDGCVARLHIAYFSCAKCSFKLCENCYLFVPTIKYQGHPHLLTLFPLIDFPFYEKCDSCGKSLWRSSFLLRCVECKFNLHFQGHPMFPHTIKHGCHIDPLILTESPLKEEEGHEEFYCDACEKERNPCDPVFYCAECEFVAEIGCVIDEILPSLSVENPPKIVEISAQQDVPSDELVQGDSNTQIDESVEKESTTEMLEIKFTKDSTSLVELDEEIAKIDSEITALTTRRDVLQGKRKQFEGSTLKEY